MFPVTRMRRMRTDERIRSMFRETSVDISDFIYPLYIKESAEDGKPEEISTMPGQYRYSVDDAIDFAGLLEDSGLTSVILFGIPDHKDEYGSSAYDPNGIIQQTIKGLKEQTDLVVIGDVCMCEYTDHGHCGIIKDQYVVSVIESWENGIEKMILPGGYEGAGSLEKIMYTRKNPLKKKNT